MANILSVFTSKREAQTFSAGGYQWTPSSFPHRFFKNSEQAYTLAEELAIHYGEYAYPLNGGGAYTNPNAIQKEIENLKKNIGKVDSAIAKLQKDVDKYMLRVGAVENNPNDGFNGAEMADLTRFFVEYSARREELQYSKVWHEKSKSLLEKYLTTFKA